MDLKADPWRAPRIRMALAAVVGVLLVAALAARTGSLFETARLDAFAVNTARTIAGKSVQAAVSPLNSGLDLPESERLLGMLALKEGDTAGADRHFEAALEGSASMVPLVRHARPKANALAQIAYGLYPSIPDSPAWLAGTLSSKQPEEALKLYLEAAGIDPWNNLVWEQAGLLAQTLRHDDVALDALGKACDINPKRNGTCMRAARLSYNAGSWEGVIHYFVLGSMPKTPPDWVLLIRAAQKLGHDADAAIYLAQARTANPADYDKLLAQQP